MTNQELRLATIFVLFSFGGTFADRCRFELMGSLVVGLFVAELNVNDALSNGQKELWSVSEMVT